MPPMQFKLAIFLQINQLRTISPQSHNQSLYISGSKSSILYISRDVTAGCQTI